MVEARIATLCVAIVGTVALAPTVGAQLNQPSGGNVTGAEQLAVSSVPRRKITPEQLENVSRRIAIAQEIVNQLQPSARARRRAPEWRKATLDSLLALPLHSLEQLQGRVHNVDNLTVAIESVASLDVPSSAATTSDLVYTPIVPCRYIDTRNVGGPINGVRGYDIALAGSSYGGDAPCNPTAQFGVGQDEFGALAMNLTIVGPAAAPGFLALKPTAASPPTSLVNWYEAGPSVQAANLGVVTIDQNVATADEFVIQTSAPVDAIADIFGAFIAPQWGTIATSIEFTGVTPSGACSVSPIGPTFGATTSLTNLSVGSMFFYQQPVSSFTFPLQTEYTRARLVGTCRGNGVIELTSGAACSTVVTSITCVGGGRPWTGSSTEFTVPVAEAYTLVVRATSGTLEWSGFKLVLYK